MAANIRRKLRKMVKRQLKNFTFHRKLPAGFFRVIKSRDLKNKLRSTVQTGWSHDLDALIWKEKRLPCAWTFKQANYRARMNDICIKGYCKECLADVLATHDLFKNKNKIAITGFEEACRHQKKRPISKQVKAKLEDLLGGNSAYAIQSKLADRIMEPGDPIPAHLPKTATMRKLKSRQLSTKSANPILALQELKRRPYRGDIQEVCLDPFCVTFCTWSQSQWYNAEFARKQAILAVDATGPRLRNLKSCHPKQTLLYTIQARGIIIIIIIIIIDTLYVFISYLIQIDSISFQI